ncbi:ATP-binding protein [Niveibacterium terrae]|uniref:ATP-binding protein n=1 Tax=Niveibacterium terrae TaxID=3373598 RepID=UPI003A8D5CC4
MKFLPRTLFGQLALALFAGLLVVQFVGLWLLLDDRGRLNYKLLSEYAAQRMGGIATVLDGAKPINRPSLAKALSVPPTTLSFALPWVEGKVDSSEDAQAFARQAAQQLEHPLTIQMLSLEPLDALMFVLHPEGVEKWKRHTQSHDGHAMPRTYVAQVRLRDGTVVSFHHVLPIPPTDLPYRVIALLVLLGLSVSALSLWAVRRLTHPLVHLADAASGLARNLNRPPLPENGPEEVRLAAQAFNAMQRDLKRLIDTRAQALSAVSHDLRLPITRMRLRLEADIDPALRTSIEHDLADMDTMIGHTLDFLRAGSHVEPVVPLQLDTLLDSVVEDMEELGATIERVGKTRSPVLARPHALRRCFANLLDNARLYGGGTITLSVEDSSSSVRVTITDNGPGINEADLEKVCEPYFRLEASRARHTGGTGLGLAIAKAIAEAHGGTLTLSCAPAQGLSATVELPR